MAEISNIHEYEQAVQSALEAGQAYYGSDTLAMDDAEYDALVRAIADAEREHPEWARQDSPTTVVGAASGGDARHAVRMLSLDNVFSAEELATWAANAASAAGRDVTWCVEPKLDGLAIALSYENGKCVRVATRGDGEAGEDVTYALDALVNVPKTLPEAWNGEVRGEVVLTHAQFAAANEIRLANGEAAFANARNGAAGSLRAKGRSYTIPLSFFAYDVAALPALEGLKHSAVLAILEAAGFTTSTQVLSALDQSGDLVERVMAIGANRPELGVDTDGAVIKADEPGIRQALGTTSRAPKWAVAYKFPADTVISVLREVSWQVGRTGVITPRATIDPVAVGGVTVTHATLHNPDDLERKGFMIGDAVTVYRAGEVVPRIEAPLLDRRDGSQEPVRYPEVCPECGGAIDKSEARWRCAAGRSCAAARWLAYACSRDALDIEGLGGKHIQTLVDEGLASTPADLFRLTTAQVAVLDRLGEASASKIIAEIDKARTAPLGRIITALGVRGTGRSLSRRLAAAFGSLEAFADASEAQLADVDGIGEEKSVLIHAELAELRSVVEDFVSLGVVGSAAEVAGDAPLAGKSVCVTGTVPGLSRTEAAEAVEKLGGKATSSVSQATSLLVAGDGAGSKLAKAESLGVEVMSAEEFVRLLREQA